MNSCTETTNPIPLAQAATLRPMVFGLSGTGRGIADYSDQKEMN